LLRPEVRAARTEPLRVDELVEVHLLGVLRLEVLKEDEKQRETGETLLPVHDEVRVVLAAHDN
jgi:hypothetical protein